MALKSGFFSVWLALVACVLFALANQERFFAVEVKSIATLDKKNGSVVVRPVSLVRWKETVEKQGLQDGDRIATGRNSSTVISFGPGRALKLGEDSQVQITAIRTTSKDLSFMINLVRGTLVAEVDGKCPKCAPLFVKAGEQTVNLASGNKIGLYKPAGNKAVKKFNPTQTWPVEPKAKPSAEALVAADFLKEEEEAPPPAPPAPTAPVPTPTPAPVAKAEGFEAQVKTPQTGLVYWTMQPLSALSNVAIDFPVSPPSEKPKQGEWRPAIEVSGFGGSKGKTEIIAAQGPYDSNVRVPLMKVRGLAGVNMRGGVKEYTFSVRGGAEVTKGKEKTHSFGDTKLTAHILTFGEYPGGPVSFGFDKLAPLDATSNAPWIEAKKELFVENAPVAVHLVSSMDYAKFIPYIRGASQVGVSRMGLASDDGIFVVRDQGVVAQLRGSAMDSASISAMMKLLGGEFVFRGKRSALNDTRGASQNALVDLVGALLDKGKVLYILKRNKLYPVSRDFIKTNNAVAKFIDSQARAIFLEKVEILDYR